MNISKWVVLTPKWLIITYLFSLATNIAVLGGLLSFIYWIGDQQYGFVKRNAESIEFLADALYTLYLYCMSNINDHYQTPVLGNYWGSLNLIIVSFIVFNLFHSQKRQFVFSSVMLVWYLASYLQFYHWYTIGLTVVMVSLHWVFAKYGPVIWRKRHIIYPLAIIYSTSAIYMIWTMWPVQRSITSFWIQQIIALVVEFIFAYEYCRLLAIKRQKTDADRRASKQDQLTQVQNFGAFNDSLQSRYATYQDKNEQYAMYEVDVDYFKQINDTYGHLVGNDVLKQVAREMQSMSKELPYKTDIYRLGGEEFSLILQGIEANDEEAIATSLLLKEKIHGLTFGEEPNQFSVTVSIGQDRVKPDDRNYLDLYNRVDKLLYEAKRAGRNRVNSRGNIQM